MALLRKNVSDAETVLLQQGKTREAIEMHRMLRNYDEAISVAESRGDPEAASMRQGSGAPTAGLGLDLHSYSLDPVRDRRPISTTTRRSRLHPTQQRSLEL